MSLEIGNADIQVLFTHPACLRFPYTPSGGGETEVIDRFNHEQAKIGLAASFPIPATGPYPPTMPTPGAFTLAGAINMSGSGDLSEWKFGWVQFITFNVADTSYLEAHGNRGLFVQRVEQGQQARVTLDRETNSPQLSPWYSTDRTAPAFRDRTNLPSDLRRVDLAFADLPSQSFLMIWTDRSRIDRSGAPLTTYLRNLWVRYDFTVVLACCRPDGTVRPLKSIDWRVDWQANVSPPDDLLEGRAVPSNTPWSVAPLSLQAGPVSATQDEAPAHHGIADFFRTGSFPQYNAIGDWQKRPVTLAAT